ncbi:MAG: prepilin-type N-terminal cleavage/methylation domain-containing protein, partial [Planctomycetaceae bacterium]|nr:prepilin-type N-terminal cleavage/methylation domain-containing protein [Planctomycetaceae bacterium]
MKKFKAFTLVELLVVVVIITLLAVIITAAVAGAMRSAKQARIAIELNQIAIALEQYKNVFGEYPPDMFDDTALVRHVKKRWPRFELPEPSGTPTREEVIEAQAVHIRTAINTVYSNMGYADVDVSVKKNCFLASLTVWLGGFPAKDSGRFSGFG